MVPPQSEAIQQISPPHYIKENYSPKIENSADDTFVKRNSSDNSFINFHTTGNDNQHHDDVRNEKVDIFYLRAREIILANKSLPSELELRDAGIYAKISISRGTRYGPFQGKWASVPQDTRFAWEVSFCKIPYFL